MGGDERKLRRKGFSGGNGASRSCPCTAARDEAAPKLQLPPTSPRQLSYHILTCQ
jgi:hypothetical protein